MESELCICMPAAHHKHKVHDGVVVRGRQKALKNWECALRGVSPHVNMVGDMVHSTWRRSSKLCAASFFICDALLANQRMVPFPNGDMRRNLNNMSMGSSGWRHTQGGP